MNQIGHKFEKDAFYKSGWVAKLINRLMYDGKKEIVEKEFYTFIKSLKNAKVNGLLLYFYALEILRPVVDIIPAVRSGRTYEIGSAVLYRRQHAIALKWLSTSIKNQSSLTLNEKILNEIIAVVFDYKSASLLKKKQLYKKIVKNRAFLRFRWK